MSKKRLMVLGVVIVTGALAEVTVGQSSTPDQKGKAPAQSLSKVAPRKYVPSRTPWGDPDVSGNFTDIDEVNTPLERPSEFDGKKIAEVSAKDLAAANEERRRRAVEAAPFITGNRTEGVAIGVPIHWLDNVDNHNSRPWLVIDPADGKIPPLTEEAKGLLKARAASRQGHNGFESYLSRSVQDRCISWGRPAKIMLPKIYGNSYQILQTPDYVAIRYEMVHETRLIPLKGRKAARDKDSPSMAFYNGDATAQWEGNTLVVDTTNFNDIPPSPGGGEAASPGTHLHMIERFTRTAPNRVEWTVTLDDPHTWVRPWTFSIPLKEDDGQPIFEYACAEGNYALRNILSAARADEKKGIEPSDVPAPAGQEE